MPGQMGNERVTTLNLSVIRLMPEENLICVRGAVPGGKGALIELRASERTPRGILSISGGEVKAVSKNPVKASKASGK